MSKAELCDFCGKRIMDKFADSSYKITEIKHAYDGYAPFLRRWSIDICPECMFTLTGNVDKYRESQDKNNG